ncbi:hypothetical protein BJX70DRAFT_25432 [Aspergillus crustosus]
MQSILPSLWTGVQGAAARKTLSRICTNEWATQGDTGHRAMHNPILLESARRSPCSWSGVVPITQRLSDSEVYHGGLSIYALYAISVPRQIHNPAYDILISVTIGCSVYLQHSQSDRDFEASPTRGL